jgi:hypothetical protein
MKWPVDFGFGGTAGPWLSWHPRASQDGMRNPTSWKLRQADGEQVTTDAPQRGFIIDLEAIRTGWESSSGRPGIPPERRWNADPARYDPQPGPDWKRAFSVPIALGNEQGAVWEQAALAGRIALDDLRKAIEADPHEHPGLLPLVRCTGNRRVQTRAGATVVPELKIERWVPRPAVLDQGEAEWSDADLSRSSESVSHDPAEPMDVPSVTDEAAYGVDPWAEAPGIPVASTPPTRDGAAPTAPTSARLRKLTAARKAGQHATAEAPDSAGQPVDPANGPADTSLPVADLYGEILTMIQAHDPGFAGRLPDEPRDAFLRRLVRAGSTLPGDLSDAAEAWFDSAVPQFEAEQPINPPAGYTADTPMSPAKLLKPRARASLAKP